MSTTWVGVVPEHHPGDNRWPPSNEYCVSGGCQCPDGFDQAIISGGMSDLTRYRMDIDCRLHTYKQGDTWWSQAQRPDWPLQ